MKIRLTATTDYVNGNVYFINTDTEDGKIPSELLIQRTYTKEERAKAGLKQNYKFSIATIKFIAENIESMVITDVSLDGKKATIEQIIEVVSKEYYWKVV